MRALSFLLVLLSLSACTRDITSLCGGYTSQNGAAIVNKDQDISGLEATGSIRLDEQDRPQLDLSLSKNTFSAVNKNEAQHKANHSVSFNLVTQYEGAEETLPLNTPIPMSYTYAVKPEGTSSAKTVEGKGQIILREQIVHANKTAAASQDIEALSGEFQSLEAETPLTGSFEVEENVLRKICNAK